MALSPNTDSSIDRGAALRLFWRVVDVALPVAAVLTTLVAVGVVIAMFWLVSLLDTTASQPTATARAARAPAAPAEAAGAPPAAEPRAAAPRPAAPHAPAHAAQPPAAAGQPPAAAACQAPARSAPPSEMTGGNSDAAKNRAIGEGLSHLGDNPDMQRRLQQPR